jgi:hypothetical protein
MIGNGVYYEEQGRGGISDVSITRHNQKSM